jgi:acyl-[acyl-carrier-protein]-phospholipid O-acyltransferase/long-chain-fatty-acid--[acyl-carrier-protein] ligase
MLRKLWALGLTKFLSNFNDNAFKAVAMMLMLRKYADDPGLQAAVIAISSMIFMLPFVAFPTIAGWMSDRFPKRSILLAAKWAELVVIFGGMFCFTLVPTVGFGPLLVAVFLMALQSTFFSPAFLGILPELFEESDLPNANGITELIAFVGIIVGCGCGALVKWIPNDSLLLGLPFVGIAITGIISAVFIPRTEAPLSEDRFGWHLLTGYISDFKYITQSRPILLSVLGHAIFMGLGALLLPSLVAFGSQELGLGEVKISMLQVAAALGIGFGCFIAGQYSAHKVEFGLVPIGAAGMMVFCTNLYLSESYPGSLFNVAAIGFFGGFFDLPLLVNLQEKTPANVRGKTLAMANAVAFGTMLLVSVAMLVLTGGLSGDMPLDPSFFARARSNFLTLSMRELYLGAGIVMLVTTALACYLLPEFLLRMILVLLTRTVYKIRLAGQKFLPHDGPVLLLANHVSFIDGLLITAASSREVHFMIHEEWYNWRWLRPFAHWARLVPVPSGRNPKALERCIAEAQKVLRNGHVLCVFPEGKITSNGVMNEFKRGFLRMLPDDVEVPIVPVHLGLVWGSIFSRRYGKVRLRRPRALPYPVTITFGPDLTRDVSPMRARLAVSELATQAECEPSPGERVLPSVFIRKAKWSPILRVVKDSSGAASSFAGVLIKSLALARVIKREAPPGETHIGVFMPPSVGAVQVAMAIMIADRIPVFLNYTASEEALTYAIDKCSIQRLLTIGPMTDRLPNFPQLVRIEDVASSITTSDWFGAMVMAVTPLPWLERKWYPRHAESVHNPATVLFSSGSTGTPKGVVLSHNNLYSNMNTAVHMLGVHADDVFLGILPFFHSFGFLMTLWLPLCWGVRVVYHHNPVDAARIGELCKDEGVTIIMTTPTFLQAYTRKIAPEQMRRLRVVITGAEKLRESVRDSFHQKFGIIPIEGFGCTELSPIVSVNMPMSIAAAGTSAGKLGSVGQAIPGVTVKVVDPDTFETRDEGEEGLLLVKGPNVMQGYLGEPERTAAVLQDGWYNTGDIVRLDRDGYIFVTGRLSRFSKIAGEMIPHGAVEDAIHDVLGTSETKVVVTGIADSARGEKLIVLHLRLDQAPADILATLRERGIPNLWLPKPADFHEISTIPVLGSGKLDLAQLREMATEMTSK